MDRSHYIIIAALVGLMIPMQSLVNARLAQTIGGPLQAATISFSVGAIFFILYILFTKTSMAGLPNAFSQPWWVWTGGLMGAFFVFGAASTVPHLGTANMAVLIIAGQLIASILLDHFGIMQEAKQINLTRLCGIILIISGTYLVMRGGK